MLGEKISCDVEEIVVHKDYFKYYEHPSFEQLEVYAKVLKENSALPIVCISTDKKVLCGAITWLVYRQMGLSKIEVYEVDKEREIEILLMHDLDYSQNYKRDAIKVASHIDALCARYNIAHGRKSRQNDVFTIADIACLFGLAPRSIQRYRRLVNLHESFHSFIKSKKIGLLLAAEISKHNHEQQVILFERISQVEGDLSKIKQNELSVIIQSFLSDCHDDIAGPAEPQTDGERLYSNPVSVAEKVADSLLSPQQSIITKQELSNRQVIDLALDTKTSTEKLESLIRSDFIADVGQQNVKILLENIEHLTALGHVLTKLITTHNLFVPQAAK
ncbi:hypothetical protein A8990_106122 [Paenibacillus taihuensis]|uniref:Uncharacterized protein n=1 Tax=Paenibacillus taihuensis TaxID=1156355 RepID=A0A3D9SBG9_9BACL|nr:hypothetical protein [Paenibacillus taihuensis]REE90617.1 hypothetical protein A8990_106122 [Paenibacillus taihuensis]